MQARYSGLDGGQKLWTVSAIGPKGSDEFQLDPTVGYPGDSCYCNSARVAVPPDVMSRTGAVLL